jgi:hypothetical protein
MKINSITGAALFICFNSSSQNVGIGTVTPLEKLSVVSVSGYGISHEVSGKKLSTYIDGSGGYFGTVTNDPFHLYTNNGAAQFTLLQNGNVGIGTINPLSKFHIMTESAGGATPNTETGFTLEHNDHMYLNFLTPNTKESGVLFGLNSGNAHGGIIYNNPANPAGLQFRTNNNNTRMVIDQNGRVGIGRSPGNYQLEVGSDFGIGFYKNSGSSYYGSISTNADSAFVINAAFGSIFGGSPPAKNIILNASPGFPLYSGSVAVGTTTPTAKFHVNGNAMIGSGNPASGYTLSVNGKIICTEAKVQLNGSWPDYVFENNYRLLPLVELEQFIRLNKHLPEIPAAVHMEKNGMELGDMVQRLVKKVEELTLYVIELKKENEQLKIRQ